MKQNNIPLLTDKRGGFYGLHPILSSTDKEIKEKYGIDLSTLQTNKGSRNRKSN